MSISTLDAALMSIPWISSIASTVVAYKIQNWSFGSRWCIGVVSLFFQTGIVVFKCAAPKYINLLPSGLGFAAIATTIMFQPHSIAAIFKGSDYYKIHGITNIKQAMMTGLFTGQIYFDKTDKYKNKNNKNMSIAVRSRFAILKESFKFFGLLGMATMLCKHLKNNPKSMNMVKSNIFLEMETLGFLLSVGMSICNIESYLMGLLIAPNDISLQMIPAYNPFIYFSTSFRNFWKGWSRPQGELLKYAVYEPLGGRNNQFVATMALFQLNNTAHWTVSHGLVGNTCAKQWTQIFGTLGVAVSTEIVLEQVTEKKYKNKWWWKVIGFAAFHSIMIPVLNIAQNKPLPINIDMMVGMFA